MFFLLAKYWPIQNDTLEFYADAERQGLNFRRLLPSLCHAYNILLEKNFTSIIQLAEFLYLTLFDIGFLGSSNLGTSCHHNFLFYAVTIMKCGVGMELMCFT